MVNLKNPPFYANIKVELSNVLNKDIVVYEDHRYILNVLFFDRFRNSDIPLEGIDLIYFDHHDDGGQAEITSTLTQYRNLVETSQAISQQEYSSFVEFNVNADDGNWVKIGMELGLINNVILIGGDGISFTDGKYIS